MTTPTRRPEPTKYQLATGLFIPTGPISSTSPVSALTPEQRAHLLHRLAVALVVRKMVVEEEVNAEEKETAHQ